MQVKYFLIICLQFLMILCYSQSITSIDYIMGKFDPSNHADFVMIPIKYADQEGRLLRKDAMESFQRMADEAAKSNIKLTIKSSTRNFEYQKGIWERKWDGTTTLEDNTKATLLKMPRQRALKILLYSSMPGTSRHHWGTDVDINNFTNNWFTKGEGKKLYDWMQKNAHKYGFCQVYSAKGSLRSSGYNEEKWHWSYMPIACEILEAAKTYMSNDLIKGFHGAETAIDIDMKMNYMFGISKECNCLKK
jgi:zinc D-Ala-D-Ala carboxypeptidase